MIGLDLLEISGLTGAILGMRNPYKSREKSDSTIFDSCGHVAAFGTADKKLANTLAHSAQKSDGKFLRMIHVQIDILAPLYWWKEMDQYKVATTTNSESTMHTIQRDPFDITDFSVDHLISENGNSSESLMLQTIDQLNYWRQRYLDTKNKEYWWQMIQLLPSSYNQLRTWDADYQTLQNIYADRKDHKLDEWRDFCKFIESLPNSDLITNAQPITLLNAKTNTLKETPNPARLEELGLPRRIHNVLIRVGITTIGDLLCDCPDDIIGIRGIGEASFDTIHEALGEYTTNKEKEYI